MLTNQIAEDAEKFFRRTPFFRLFLALVAGIVFQVTIGYYFPVFISTFLLGIALVIVGFIYKKTFHLRWIFGLGVSLCLFSAGLFQTERADRNTRFSYVGQQHTYIAKIVSPPSERARSMLCELRLISNLDNGESLNYKVLAYLAKDSLSLSLQAGERILINAAFEKPRDFGNPYGFNYPRHLKHKGIAATSFVPAENWQRIDDEPMFSIVNLAMKSRNRLLSIYKNLGISGDEYGVLAALTLGCREEINRDLEASYTAAGVTHVLSVSGMHVGVIFIVLNFLLGFMDYRRSTTILKAVIIILFLWFYSFMTGLSPPVVRSALMLSLIVFSKAMSRNSDIYNVVFVSAFFMLAYNPYYLFDIGFQLSYLAVLGIVYYQPKFLDLWKTENKILKPLWSLITVSFAAQLVTTPLSLYYFHNFPNYFWISNMIIVPMSSWIIYLAFALLFLYQVPYLNDFVAIVLTWALRLTNEIIVFIHHLPYSQLKGVWFEGWQLATICLAVILLTVSAVYRQGKALFATLVLTVLLVSVNLHSNYQAVNSGNKLIVSAMQSGHAVSFVNNTTSYLLTNNLPNAVRAVSPFYMKHGISSPVLLDSTHVWHNSNGFISFGDKRILILSENVFNRKTTDQILDLDYLILTNNLRISLTELMKFLAPRKIILDQSYRIGVLERLKNDCLELDLNCLSIGSSGAFISKW